MNKKILLLKSLYLTLFVGIIFCNPKINNKKITHFKPGVFETNLLHPESIAYDSIDFYVSEFGTDLLTAHVKDGKGSIVKLNAAGKLLIKNIAKTPLNKPKGIIIIKKTLLVCDIDSLKAINLETGVLEYGIDFGDIGVDLTTAGGTGLNDVVQGKNENLVYVSVTNNGKIYQVDLQTKTKKEIASVPYANGLTYDKNKNLLYAVGFTNQPSVTKIDLSTNFSSLLENTYIGKSGLDGLVLDNNDLVISDWGTGADGKNEVGVIVKYNLITQKTTQIDIKSSTGKIHLNGPADMILIDGYLFIPTLGEGKIYAIKL